MKKIIFFLVYLTVNSFSYDINNGCCASNEDDLGHTGQGGEGSHQIKLGSYVDKPSNYDFTVLADNICVAHGEVSNQPKYFNDSRKVSQNSPAYEYWYNGDYGYITTMHTCKCNEPDTESTRPDNIDGGTWEFLGTLTCRSVPDPDPEGDGYDDWLILDTYNNHDGEKFSSDYRKNCCQMSDYWIWKDNKYGQCDAPRYEIPSVSTESECLAQTERATDLKWEVDVIKESAYCCGIPKNPTCNSPYINIGSIGISSDECLGTEKEELEQTYLNVDIQFYVNPVTEFTLCCATWDNNTTSPTDTNDSDNPTDSNPTDSNDSDNNDSSDSSDIADKLDELNKDNNSNSDRNHDDLDELNKDNNSNSDRNHEDLIGINSSIQSGASSVVSSISQMSTTAHQDAEDIKGLLGEIVDNTSDDSDSNSTDDGTDDNSSSGGIDLGYLDGLVEFKDLISTSLSNADTMFNDVKATINGDISYSFDTGGNNCIYHFSYHTLSKDVNLCQFGSLLRPFVTFILSIYLLYSLIVLNVWLYFKVFGAKE